MDSQVRALADIDYPCVVDLELKNRGDDPMRCCRRSFDHMRGLIREMGYRAG